MTPHNNSYHWLVLDWIVGGGHHWLRTNDQADEYATRFLLITRSGRNWTNEAPTSLPEDGFVLITLLEQEEETLTEESLDVDKLLTPRVSQLRMWCHYGGKIDLKRLRGRWREFTYLGESLRDKLTKRLPALYPYPTPISDSHPLPWHREWEVIRELIRTYEPAMWDDLIAKLDRTWGMANAKLREEAALAARNDWASAAQAAQSLRSLLPAEGEESDSERLGAFLREAASLQLGYLAPRAAGSGEVDARLSEKFKAALDGLNALSSELGSAASAKVIEGVEPIRNSLRDFLAAYDGE